MTNKNTIFILTFVLVLCMGTDRAEEGLKYNKNAYPVFEFFDSPLICTMKGSYQIEDTVISGDITNYEDSNIKLKYLLKGRKVAPGIKIKIGPEEHYNESTGQVEVTEPTKNEEWTELHFETELSSINSYLNKPSTQADFSVEYEVMNDNVEYLTPFIFELGDWPKYISGKNIDDLLNIPVYDNYLLIYGTEKVLIFAKDSKSFYYKLNKTDDHYCLSIQKKIAGKQTDSLNTFFRPFRIKSEIRNINILPPANIYSSLRMKPELIFEISNKDIDQLNFTYKFGSNTITKNKKLESDGTIKFDEMVLPEGEKIWYPFDSYNSKIIVEPPLLIKEEKYIDMPAGSAFTGKLQIDNNEIEISIQRSVKEKIKYILPLTSFIILLIIAILFKQSSLLWYIQLVICVYFVWYVNSNIGYLNSIGSFTSIIVLIISTWIFINRNTLIQ